MAVDIAQAKLSLGLALWVDDIANLLDKCERYGKESLSRDDSHKHGASLLDTVYYSQKAVELQAQGLQVFASRLEGLRLDPAHFSSEAREQFWNRNAHRNVSYTTHGESRSVSLENAWREIHQSTLHDFFDFIRSLSYRGVHSSDGLWDNATKQVIPNDLSTADPALAQRVIRKYQRQMDLSEVVKATSFVMHPSCFRDFWPSDVSGLQERRQRMEHFYQNFAALARYHAEQKYTFPFTIENLEFPKFPATVEELVDMYARCTEIAKKVSKDINVNVCFDFQHARHSLSMLNEPQNRSVYDRIHEKTSADTELIKGWSNTHRKFVGWSYHPDEARVKQADSGDIVAAFFSKYAEIIAVVHAAGNYDTLPGRKHSYVSETQGGIYLWTEKDLKPQMLDWRKAVSMMLDAKLVAAVISEDQRPGGMKIHQETLDALSMYMEEKVSKVSLPL